MQTTYEAITTEARNYLMRGKLLKTVEDIDTITLRTIMNRYTSKRRVTYSDKV